MREKITAFIDSLIIYDYILFGSTFLLFLLLIVLAIVIRRRLKTALFLIFFAFLLITVGVFEGYIVMHKFLYKNSIKITYEKKLNFTKAVVLKGVLLNESKFDFRMCEISAKAYKNSTNSIKNKIYSLKPFQNMSILEYDIKKGAKREFKIIVEPFVYSKKYNIVVEADCR